MLVRPNPKLALEVERQALFQATMKEAAESCLSLAENIAPRGSTGHYSEAFEIVQVGNQWRLQNNDFAAHWVEWGSVHQPPQAILRRAVTGVGLHLDESPKP